MPVDGRSRQQIEALQLQRLRFLLGELASNAFYAPRLRAIGLSPDAGDDAGQLPDLETFRRHMPCTTKAQLVEDQQRYPPYGSNLSYPLERYTRFHQTSGTTGQPMRWLDTSDGWAALLDVWKRVFQAAGATAEDRAFVPFSFGPFLGFWTAFEAAAQLGMLAIPGGGLSSSGRLRLLLDNQATMICCTPTYALRLAEVAKAEGIDLTSGLDAGLEPGQRRTLIVAGEAGGSVPAVRERLSQAWGGARVFDHHGMTEVGPVSFPNPAFPDLLHVDEGAFLAEILDPATGEPVTDGDSGELVLTTLRRPGSPLLRYRTGDLVRKSLRSPEELGTAELALDGGILARVDDMVVVRGVNLYPSAVEGVIRQRPGVAEFRVVHDLRGALAELRVTVEPAPEVDDGAALARQLEHDLRTAFHVRLPVTAVAPGTLPRFELKARRWIAASENS